MDIDTEIDMKLVNNEEVRLLLEEINSEKTKEELGLILSKIVKIKKKIVTVSRVHSQKMSLQTQVNQNSALLAKTQADTEF
jgi:hypothetical protein